MASSQVLQRSQVSFLPAPSERGGIGKIHFNESHPGTLGRLRAEQWRPLGVRPPQGAVAVRWQAMGGPPAPGTRGPKRQASSWSAGLH